MCRDRAALEEENGNAVVVTHVGFLVLDAASFVQNVLVEDDFVLLGVGGLPDADLGIRQLGMIVRELESQYAAPGMAEDEYFSELRRLPGGPAL